MIEGQANSLRFGASASCARSVGRRGSALRSALLGAALSSAATFAAPSSALTPGQAYHKATQFLRTQGTTGWGSAEAQPVLLGEAVAADPLAAGPRSTTLLASLELGSVDARARRARALGSLGLASWADANALLAAQVPASGFGVSAEHLPTPLDTALAVQALDAAGSFYAIPAAQAANNFLRPSQLTSGPTSGMWPLLRVPDAAGGGAAGDVATTAQVVLALAPRQSAYAAELALATSALASANPTRVSDRALRLLALLETSPAGQGTALQALADLQLADGSFGPESLAQDRVYATALVARTLLRGSQVGHPFDSDGDGTADGPDLDSDNDGVCDKGESGAGCTGSDLFPTDPAEWADLDLDGAGDNIDPDLDGDGIANDADDYPTLAQERANADGDAFADTVDPDDDNDGLLDVDELLAGTDPLDADTDGDSFRDYVEAQKNRDPLNATEYPLPDGDVFPLGALPDGVVDARDELLTHRILRGLVVVPSGDYEVFLRHADVAPLNAGSPAPSGAFDAADALVITRRVRGMVAVW